MATHIEMLTSGAVTRVRFESDNGIPLLGPEARARLSDVLTELEAASGPHSGASVIVFESTGRVFIAGADINELRALNIDNAAANSREGQSLMHRISALPATTLAAVHGACAGGGCELALACDMRIAASSARIGLPETGIGIIPGWGGTVRATRLLGGAAARRMILTGELLTADQAHALGLVDEVAAEDQFREAIERRVQLILAKGPAARATAKRLIAAFEGPDPAAQFEAEALAFADCFRTGEPVAGMTAFLNKQPPVWTTPPSAPS